MDYWIINFRNYGYLKCIGFEFYVLWYVWILGYICHEIFGRCDLWVVRFISCDMYRFLHLCVFQLQIMESMGDWICEMWDLNRFVRGYLGFMLRDAVIWDVWDVVSVLWLHRD